MSINEVLEEIEQHFNARLPKLYIKWTELGITQPEKYLWVNDAEWIIINDIVSVLERQFSYCNILRKLIPFAFTGGGDYWCFDIENNNVNCILLCKHDDDVAEIYAPNFEKWFYRCALDYAIYVENNNDSISEAIANFNLWAVKLVEANQIELGEDLKLIATLIPKISYWGERKLEEFGFITIEERDERILRYLGIEFLNKEVVWSELKQ